MNIALYIFSIGMVVNIWLAELSLQEVTTIYTLASLCAQTALGIGLSMTIFLFIRDSVIWGNIWAAVGTIQLVSLGLLTTDLLLVANGISAHLRPPCLPLSSFALGLAMLRVRHASPKR